MNYLLKRSARINKHICLPEDQGGAIVVTLYGGPQQRHMLALLMEGILSAGDTLYDVERKRYLVGDVGQLTQDVARGAD